MNGIDMMREFVWSTWGGKGTLVEKYFEMAGVPMRSKDYD